MRGLKIGYILTVSFLLVLTVVMGTLGYYPAPKGPKAPEYPRSSGLEDGVRYNNQLQEYNDQLKRYDEEQKMFLEENVVSYTRNVLVFWLIMLGIFGAIGLLLAIAGLEVVGAGFAFTGVWAILYGPIGFFMWYVNGLVRSFGARAEQDFSSEPILQAASVVALIISVALSALGVAAFRKKS